MTDSHMHNPGRDSTEETRRNDVTSALNDNIMDRVLARENVKRAWLQVRRNRGAPGIDGMTVLEFPTYARNHWQEVRQALMEGKYRPSPVRRVEIPKSSGGKRKLGIPTVVDRVIVASHIPEPSFG